VPALPAPYPAIEAATDANGKFLLKDVPAGLWSAHLAGTVSYSCPAARVPLQAGQRVEGIELAATPAPRVKGVVVGLHGKPLTSLENMAVELCSRQSDGKYALAPQPWSSDSPGALVTYPRQPGEVQYRVFLGGEGCGASPWLKVEEGKEVELEFRLRPYQRVTGVVREKGTNRPIPGAVVKAEPVVEGEPPVARAVTGVCDNSGRFVLANVAPAEYAVSVAAEGFVFPAPVRVKVEEKGNGQDVVLEMQRPSGAK
jgi:hypothetical protein